MTREELQAIKVLADAQSDSLAGARFKAAFIASARTAVPALVAEVERLQSERESLYGLLRAYGESLSATDKQLLEVCAESNALNVKLVAALAEVERLREELAATAIRHVCEQCGGIGSVDVGAITPTGDLYHRPCDACGGTGYSALDAADLSPERKARLRRYIDGGER